MEDLGLLLNKDLISLQLLNRYTVYYGVLEEYKDTDLDITVLNPDGSTSIHSMKVEDVVYLTDTGTLTVPGKHFLDKFDTYINTKYDTFINNLTDKMLEKEMNETEIDTYFMLFSDDMNKYLKDMYINSGNDLENVLNIDNQNNKYLYDFTKLSQYIGVKIVKR